MTFYDFIVKSPRHKRYLFIVLAGAIIQFAVFKLLYPFADFFSDSYSYIYAAYANLDINIWPIGYSKFLRGFHFITHSDTALVGFQYFFLEISCLYFFFTISWFYQPGRTTKYILFTFLFFNPLFLYLCNYVNSDPLFTTLSMLWLTELIWIIQRPRLYHILTQALLLFLAFTVRHNAMYYPLIGSLAFVLSHQSLWRKIAGVLLGLLLILLFVNHERNAAYKMYGVKQFSPMSGWLLANNALYVYGHIQVNNTELPTPEVRELDTLAKDFYHHLKPGFNEYLSDYVANFFIRQPEAPLKRYFRHHYKPTNEYNNIIAWGNSSVVFEDFGGWIIKKNTTSFVKYFIAMNVKNYFLPPLEKLEIYNLGVDEVKPIAQHWFDYKGRFIKSVSPNLQGNLLFIYPGFFLIVNIYFIASIYLFLFKNKYRKINENFRRIILLALSFFIANFFFCLVTTVIVFRYEVFPMIIFLSFSSFLIQLLEQNKVSIHKKAKSILVGNACM